MTLISDHGSCDVTTVHHKAEFSRVYKHGRGHTSPPSFRAVVYFTLYREKSNVL